jgi:hypothetical protein
MAELNSPAQDKLLKGPSRARSTPASPGTPQRRSKGKSKGNKVVLFRHSITGIVSSTPALLVRKEMYTSLIEHKKIVTRRDWLCTYADSHLRAYENRQYVRVWSRPDAGCNYGYLAGHLLYTHVYKQRLCDMTLADVMMEGFMKMDVNTFLAQEFPECDPTKMVWVFMFVFYPLYA